MFDLPSDPGETKDVAGEHPEVVKQLTAAYDAWWAETLPCLENETAVGPAVNPFREQYWKQLNGPGPNNVPPRPAPAPTRPGR